MSINDKYIKGPFKADFLGGIIWSGPDNFHFADVRGWGQLGYEKDGAKIQDANLQFMVDALNEKVARDAQKCAQACSKCEGGDHKQCSMKECHCDQKYDVKELKAKIDSLTVDLVTMTTKYTELFVSSTAQSHAVVQQGYGFPDTPTGRLYSESEFAELKKEVEWLSYYKRNVYSCLGPGDDDINMDIIKSFVREKGIDALPKAERIRHLEYLDEHKER